MKSLVVSALLIAAAGAAMASPTCTAPKDSWKPEASFKKELEAALGKKVEYEPEFWSSMQAERWQGKTDKLDASAAAIILQSFLDKHNSKTR